MDLNNFNKANDIDLNNFNRANDIDLSNFNISNDIDLNHLNRGNDIDLSNFNRASITDSSNTNDANDTKHSNDDAPVQGSDVFEPREEREVFRSGPCDVVDPRQSQHREGRLHSVAEHPPQLAAPHALKKKSKKLTIVILVMTNKGPVDNIHSKNKGSNNIVIK